jgi:SAM-dependent methyltransferase
MTSPNINHPTASVPVVTDPDVLLQAMLTSFNQRLETVGELIMPGVPAMADYYRHRIGSLFDSLAIPFKEAERNQLYQILDKKLAEGFALSPHSRLRLKYHPAEPPKTGLTFEFSVSVLSDIEEYQEWMNQNEQPWFGMTPDAKVLEIAQLIEHPKTASVLDIGAATGRNTLTLAQRGHPVDALELVPPYCDRLRQLLARICDTLRPGGLLLFSLFLAVDDYEPDKLTRELSHVTWSCIFTRSELAEAMERLPLTLLSDESVLEYEREHLPTAAWPPTGWFIKWCQGENLFPLQNQGKPPMELRWILCQRR